MFELPYLPEQLFRLIDRTGGLDLHWNGDLRFCPLIEHSSELKPGMQIVQVRRKTKRRPKLFYGYEIISPSFKVRKYHLPMVACRPIIETVRGCVLGDECIALEFSELSMHHNEKRIVSPFVRPLRLS